MKVSKYVLVNSYGVTDGSNGTPNHFFETRTDRNNYFANNPTELLPGLCCAIGGDPSSSDIEAEVWELEKYNGANWVLESVDPNYSLVITEEGLNAITKIKEGLYHFEIAAVKIKQNHIVYPPKSLLVWTNQDFEADGDIILDTNSNANFTLENNLSWRRNMANGGIQYTVKIDVDTYGETNGRRYDEYTIGAIGLYVSDPDEPTRQLLFAIGNLNANVPKYTTTPKRVGNSIKLLLNTVISNLGYIPNVHIEKDSVNSIPEVDTEVDLMEKYGTEISPYNFFLVDNYAGTNVPALAARQGDPAKDEVKWLYFTPKYDVLDVTAEQVEGIGDYLLVTWDEEHGKFKRTTSLSGSHPTSNNLTGIKVGTNVIFAGNVACYDLGNLYDITITNPGTGYKVDDLLVYTTSVEPIIEFKVKVTKIDEAGGVADFKIISITGAGQLEIAEANWDYDPSTPSGGATGQHFATSITSAGTSGATYVWDFPGGESTGDTKDWYNKPLYADKDWTQDSGWIAYCEEIGLDPDIESKNRTGKLTIKENDFFVGWCTGTGAKSSIKLAMDLQDQASSTDYGTTRYATNTEVKEKTGGISTVTAMTPQTTFDNYLQRSKPSSGAGSAWDNRIGVNSYVQFNTTLVGKGATPTQAIMEDENLSFFGTSYRARWADLAEYYRSDKVYPAGTLITMGCGAEEITKAITECNGIVSERPGYELGEKTDEKDLPVALVGKVPVIFDKQCNPKFGDRIYLSQIEPGKASNIPYGKCLGKIIDKNKDLITKGTVLCSVRISF